MSLMSELETLGQTMATNISNKGVSASASDGLTTLAGKISQIQTGGSGGASNIVQGTFTTANSGGGTGSISLSYSGNGYPIACMVWVDGGPYNNSSSGNTTWYNSTSRYDCGFYSMVKSRTTTTPDYSTSGSDNYGTVTIIYKNSTSSSTQYTRTSGMDVNTYTSSSTNAAAGTSCVRFKGNGKTLAYYIGNRGSSSIGLARNTKFAYIVIYSS